MSSSDAAFRRRAVLAAIVFGALALGGCTFRPLYADVTPTGIVGGADRGAGRQLPGIEVALQNEREGIELRNELIYLFSGGGTPAARADYRLDLTIRRISGPLAIAAVSGRPTAAELTLVVSYNLVRVANSESVFRASVVSRASYDRTVQRFANIRAERDAEDRAARSAAETIRNQVAAYFARTDRR